MFLTELVHIRRFCQGNHTRRRNRVGVGGEKCICIRVPPTFADLEMYWDPAVYPSMSDQDANGDVTMAEYIDNRMPVQSEAHHTVFDRRRLWVATTGYIRTERASDTDQRCRCYK
jgi:hypothetical protein